MPEFFTIKASDLVLRVSEKVDPAKFDISKYEAFLDVLYFEREFERGNKKFGIEQHIKQGYATFPLVACYSEHLLRPIVNLGNVKCHCLGESDNYEYSKVYLL